MAELKEDLGIIGIDHVTFCVNSMKNAMAFCENVLGMEELIYVSPHTPVSGMISTVMKKDELKFALNEGTNETSQITDFIKKHGEGVQHIAIKVKDLKKAVEILQKRGLEFMTPVLEDKDDKGSMQQIFTKPLFGGMFFEFIQRNGSESFGHGNVQALYDAVEEHQFANQ